jgi:RNA polymerase-interacting CarD/CdnL/TRCF family regulator
MALKKANKPKTVPTPRISSATIRKIARFQATDKILESLEDPEE